MANQKNNVVDNRMSDQKNADRILDPEGGRVFVPKVGQKVILIIGNFVNTYRVKSIANDGLGPMMGWGRFIRRSPQTAMSNGTEQ